MYICTLIYFLIKIFMKIDGVILLQIFFVSKGGRRMCHFLKPLKLTQELSQKMSYSSELWYGSCFYDVYSGTAKKRRRNRRKPPSAAEFFLPFLAELYFSESFEPNLFFSQKKYPNIFHWHL